MTVTKSADRTSFDAAGAKITYSYHVTNTGDVALNLVVVVDSRLGPVCTWQMIPAGGSESCNAIYFATQADMDIGSIANTATVTGHPAAGGTEASATSDQFTINANQNAAISLTKTPNPSTAASGGAVYSAAGNVIVYRYAVKNTGNVTLHSVGVKDDNLATVDCPSTSVLPGRTMDCYATYEATGGDVQAGQITNGATAAGTAPDGSKVTDKADATATFDPNPTYPPYQAVAVVKSANVSSFDAPDQTITYTYHVINNSTINSGTGIGQDYRLAPGIMFRFFVHCMSVTLPAGTDDATCTAPYTTTQAEVDGGGITNSVAAPVAGVGNYSAGDRITVPADQSPALKVQKIPNRESFDAPDQTIQYSYEVTNTGNVTLNQVSVTDSKLGTVTCPSGPLAPHDTETCETRSYSTSQEDVDLGGVGNIVTATAVPPTPSVPYQGPFFPKAPDVVARQLVVVPADQNPAMTVTKKAVQSSFDSVGAPLDYRYVVTNTGNTTLDSVRLTDSRVGAVIDCSPALGSLRPGDSAECSASDTTSQADLDAGAVTNRARAFAVGPNGQRVSDRSPKVTVDAVQNPGISVSKRASRTTFAAPGARIVYRYRVANTGNVTLDPVSLSDSRLGDVRCPQTSLAPGAVMVCRRAYTTTQADVDAGSLSNTATVTGAGPGNSGTAKDQSDRVSVDAAQTPDISVVKSASVPSFAVAGTPITYTYRVTNTGNVTVSGVSVSDNRVSSVSCPDTTLAPGDYVECTGDYTTTAGDVAAGGVSNTGTVSGTAANNEPVGNSDSLNVPLLESPRIGILKLARPGSFSRAGTSITYRYLVTNSGDVPLNTVTVFDNRLGQVDCPQPSLPVGGRMVCTATTTTTQAQLDAGGVTNDATARATTPGGAPVTDSTSLTVQGRQRPAVSLSKSVEPSSFSQAGTHLRFFYRVANTGNVTLSGVAVTDLLPGLSAVSCPSTQVAPGGTVVCTADYRPTQADLDQGGVSNKATVQATAPSGQNVGDESSVRAAGDRNPSAKVVKSATPDRFSAAGTPISYRYTVTNTGNVTLNPVRVSDDQLGAVTCPAGFATTGLAPGASETCTARYVTTVADVDQGGVTNTGTVSGTTPTGGVVTGSSTLTVGGLQRPALSVVKTADVSAFLRPGTSIKYTFLVTNTGNVTARNVHVIDPTIGPVSCPATVLPPGEIMTCTGHTTPDQSHLDSGHIHNTATVSGTAPDGTTVSATGSRTVDALQDPAVRIVKTASPTSFNAVGTRISYRYRVTNVGNLTAGPVRVVDRLSGLSTISCPQSRLGPGQSMTCTAHYTTTQADVNRGLVDNTGLAIARAANGVIVSARQPHTVLGSTPSPSPSPTCSPTTSPTTSPTASPTASPTSGPPCSVAPSQPTQPRPTQPQPTQPQPTLPAPTTVATAPPSLAGTGLPAWTSWLAGLGFVAIIGGGVAMAAARRGR